MRADAGCMDISIIIVNYNVRFFLEQCLHSLYRAKDTLRIEIIVVDNHSVDGSVQVIREKFPEVILIENKENKGFSKANNQGIQKAKGKYILLLNPDTVIQEDTLQKCFEFMERHPDAGALGVKMVDGKGHFLPESKRGLPTPSVAFYKIFGLSKLFPRSKIFGKYHLTYLDKNSSHCVDVLSGAFMFIRSEVLKKLGGLDEDYFMYGEDIDLSYRITKMGYKNYYFSETSIIHYKGESTKKSSINYVIMFYKAMLIFANKHFSHSRSALFRWLIYMAIFFRASMSIGHRFFSRLALPVLDTLIVSSSIFLFALWYERTFKSHENYYDRSLLMICAVCEVFLIMLNVYFQGGYEKHPKYKHIFQGHLFGLLTTLSVYALLPESMRFSRAIVLLGALLSGLYFTISRWLFYYIGLKRYSYLSSILPKNILIVGDEEEYERVKKILLNMSIPTHPIGLIKVQESASIHPNFSGFLKDIEEIIRMEKTDEVIFCSKQLLSRDIIYWMIRLSYLPVQYKIAPPNGLYIIGSNDIHTQGEWYTLEFKPILLPANQRKKRTLDIFLSMVLLLTLPLHWWFFQHKKQLLQNIYQVLIGKKTWIGLGKYTHTELPKIKPSVLFIGKAYGYEEYSEKAKELSVTYCKEYKPITDLVSFIKLIHFIDEVC